MQSCKALSDFAFGGEYGAERDVGDSEMPRDGFGSVRAVAQRPLHVARGCVQRRAFARGRRIKQSHGDGL